MTEDASEDEYANGLIAGVIGWVIGCILLWFFRDGTWAIWAAAILTAVLAIDVALFGFSKKARALPVFGWLFFFPFLINI